VDTADGSATQFQAYRGHLRAVAYRMLGSLSEADDAVQETWLRLNRSGTDVDNLRAWLTTVVSRVCLDMLRARVARHEEPLDVHVPDPVVTAVGDDPEQQALLADSVGLALLVVLDTLSPAERLAFVLHDIFAVPFERIGPILDRSPAAAKQLASRARRRLSEVGSAAEAETDPARQREVLGAFLAASRDGDFAGLLAVLDPDVVLRADVGSGPFGPSRLLRGASEVAAQAMTYAPMARFAQPVLVNGSPGHLIARDGRPLVVIGMSSRNGKITEINILADPDRLSRLGLEDLIG
jgi:RNA polymerase sigma-70 factor (ECF subfamily)